MDCREFRNKHVAFVDDLLPAVEMERMLRHVIVCSNCSRHDTAIRRSLLLVRNLPPVEPSPDFMVRLNARLEALGPAARVDVVSPRPHLTAVGSFAALAASLAAVAYLAMETTHYFAPESVSPPAAAVAQAVDSTPAPIANAAFVASVSTGMPVWPAVLMVGQAPVRFASLEFHDVDETR
ncbi:MAG TPA: zf-HC2 domain-containing protein [Gemmatimonadaceae bacterium]|nr:zf-HC2 domain-containing protein [Gemmatimonadaceae bacterium]